MLVPIRSSHFKKDLKRARKQAKDFELLKEAIEALIQNKKLEKRHRDHELAGNWKGYRECHLSPDWLLIYKTVDNELRLARLGSHSDLFG
jgi:mRNA interferase YafQ